MFNNFFNYNKTIYLEILNNTINDYNHNILKYKFNDFRNNYLSRRDYYDIYNHKYLQLCKYFSYYYCLNFNIFHPNNSLTYSYKSN